MTYYSYSSIRSFDTLLGQTFDRVESDNYEVTFYVDTPGALKEYRLLHIQDCCEDVTVDEIHGDLSDLIGSPILLAEETISTEDAKSEYDESCTWSFYKLATIKGYVTIKFYGTSNGYYSETVDLVEITK